MVGFVSISARTTAALLTGFRFATEWLLSGFPACAGNDRPWPKGKADLRGIGSAGQNPPRIKYGASSQSPFAKGGDSNKDYFSSLQTENAVSLYPHLLSFCVSNLDKLGDFFKLLVFVQREEVYIFKGQTKPNVLPFLLQFVRALFQ